ncbi:MAG: hypothetical protein MK135_11115, partial [Polyangiaceae bacterium]|nr:hypothetical protein [Polyangiaceae bacterium]
MKRFSTTVLLTGVWVTSCVIQAGSSNDNDAHDTRSAEFWGELSPDVAAKVDELRDLAVPGSHGERSGSRLKVQVLDGGSGAYLRTALFDEELNEECSFHPVATDEYACIPEYSTRVAFTDENCTKPVGLADPAAPPTKFLRLESKNCDGVESYSFYVAEK